MQDGGRASPRQAPTTCRVQLLGELRVSFAGQEILRSFTHKIGGLLGYLACFLHRAHSRDALIELFWPEADLEAGRASLRSALPVLRRLLEPLSPEASESHSPLLIVDRQTVRLDPQQVTTDVAEFERVALVASRATSPADAAALWEEAVSCYGGELLSGYSEPWVLAERKRLAEAYVQALRRLAAARSQQGDLPGAIEAARRAVQVDPLGEAAQFDLIRYYVKSGQSGTARRRYLDLERRLKAELGATPSQSLSDLLAAAEPVPLTSDGQTERPAEQAAPAPRLTIPPLPVPLTPFFGREAEIAQVRALLEGGGTRLVTLTGLGGTGKTRLALEVARRAQQATSDGRGVAFVSLVDLTDPRLLGQTIRGALNLPLVGDTDPLDQIATALSDQRFLLVLDNFEQLLEAGAGGAEGALLGPEPGRLGREADSGPAPRTSGGAGTLGRAPGAGMVEQLLARAPDLICLVTSRLPLGLTAEAEYLVPPLPTPAATASPERLLEFASVRLFLNRAQAARPDFQVTAANAEAVTRLLQALDGIPLALELAAARSPVLTPAQMLQHLADRFGFLVSRHRDVAERHRTLRAALEWSYQTLPEDQQRLLARLSVFRGGWSLEAAEAIGDGDPSTILDQMLQLRDASLLTTEEAGEVMRFRMLETVREYAAERLMEWGETKAVCGLHRDWYLRLAEQARREWDGPEQATWLDRLDTEHDNLRAALGCCFAEESGAESGLRLTRALARFWETRGHLSEGRAYLAAALGREGAAPPTRERAGALNAAAVLAWMQGDYGPATALFEESLSIERTTGDPSETAWSIYHLGHVATEQGDYEKAKGLTEESLAMFRQLKNPIGIASSLADQGNVALKQGDLEAARSSYEESLRIFQELGDKMNIAIALNNLGKIAREQGDTGAARAMHRESLAIRVGLGDKGGYPWSLEAFARLAAPMDPERAARLWGAAESLRESLGWPLPPNEHPEYDRALAAVREALGEEAFAGAWAAGRAMTLDETIRFALEE